MEAYAREALGHSRPLDIYNPLLLWELAAETGAREGPSLAGGVVWDVHLGCQSTALLGTCNEPSLFRIHWQMSPGRVEGCLVPNP